MLASNQQRKLFGFSDSQKKMNKAYISIYFMASVDEIQLKLEPNGKGAFVIEHDGVQLAEMVIAIDQQNLTVYHTEVSKKLKGEGIGSKLINTMVDYARKHQLKVIALCPFVSAQFKRHSELYADVWNQNWH